MNESSKGQGKYNISVDINGLRQMKQEMLASVTKLEESCKKCYQKLDESKKIYDSPTGDYFREKANEFVLKNQSYIVDVVIPYINELDGVIATYESTNTNVKSSIKGRVR